MSATPVTCTLCQKPDVTNLGMFYPNGAYYGRVVAKTMPVMGLPAIGKSRVIFYGVCDECLRMGRDAVATLVEEKLFSSEDGNV